MDPNSLPLISPLADGAGLSLNVVDILRLGFSGLAFLFLYFAYSLSQEVVRAPAGADLTQQRKAVTFYGVLCVVVLLLAISVELIKLFIPPRQAPAPLPQWVTATVLGQLTNDELKQHPLEVSTWMASDPDKTFRYFRLTSQAQAIQVPAAGGMLTISAPHAVEGTLGAAPSH